MLKKLHFLFVSTLILVATACTTIHVHNKGVPPGHAKKGKKHKHNEVRYEIKEKKNGTEIKIKTR